jgi:integrase/recombinase XerD
VYENEYNFAGFRGAQLITPALVDTMEEIKLHQFAEKLEVAGFSKRSIRDYPISVGVFLRYLNEHENVKTLAEVTPEHIKAYHTYLHYAKFRNGRHLAAKTISTRLGVLKTFYQLMHREKLIEQDYSHLIVLPKRHKHLPRNIPAQEQIIRLLERVKPTTPLTIRDRAILEVLYATGIRNQELRTLTIDSYDKTERTLFIRGKGSRDRLVPLGSWVVPYLWEYLEAVRPKFIREPTDIMFLTKTGRMFEQDNLIDLIRRYAKHVGLEYITPHTLRHACATHLLKNGADIRYVQELLGHKDLGSTQIYTHIDISSLKSVHKRYHPRERMDDGPGTA